MRWLVTGASGFIGTNLVVHLLESGQEVVGVDDFSRPGSRINEAYLSENFGFHVQFLDVSKPGTPSALLSLGPAPDAVVHLAGQVSFLGSLADPLRDFEVNAYGSINILEYVRKYAHEAVAIGMSSNKVYGDLSQIRIIEEELRYVAPDFPQGFDETLPLDFRGPYGCSKGAADQYFVDYGRMFGLSTVSLRQSSVYGPHQHPQSDQGWVAHLVAMAANNEHIQLNGKGKQVRDLLHVTDLCRLFIEMSSMKPTGGLAINVGGGPANSLSILDLFKMLGTWSGQPVSFSTGELRPADQPIFVSSNKRVQDVTHWTPSISAMEGVWAMWESARPRSRRQ